MLVFYLIKMDMKIQVIQIKSTERSFIRNDKEVLRCKKREEIFINNLKIISQVGVRENNVSKS